MDLKTDLHHMSNTKNRKLRIYVDTSVIGGCEDDEFRESSRRLIDRFVTGKAILMVSTVTVGEVQRAPLLVRQVLSPIPPEHVERMKITRNRKSCREVH